MWRRQSSIYYPHVCEREQRKIPRDYKRMLNTLHGPVDEEAARVVANAVEPAVPSVPQHSGRQEQAQSGRPGGHQPRLHHLPREEPPRVQQRLHHQNKEGCGASRVEKLLSLEVRRQQEHSPLDGEVHRSCFSQHITHDPAFPALSTSRKTSKIWRFWGGLFYLERSSSPGATPLNALWSACATNSITLQRCIDYSPLFQNMALQQCTELSGIQ